MLRTVWAFVRLGRALAGTALSFLWRRRRSTVRFRRRLRREGLPPDVVEALTEGYRDMVDLSFLRRGRQ